MRLEDVPQVTEVDREAFPTMWPPPSFKRELENPMARYLVAWERGRVVPYPAPRPAGVRRWVTGLSRRVFPEPPPAPLGTTDLIVGYAGLWFAWDEAHLMSLAVRASHHRQGIGELLLMASLELATRRKAHYMVLETRVSNYEAQALYEKYGFARSGVRTAYYTDNGEDALLMTTDTLSSPTYQARLQGLQQAYQEKRGRAEYILEA